ncbi:hypothetical protein WICANDRAFT_94873 [Wickerhamomyces anomalus NRRL Y-366-8]|uniref:Uncharacterized protein n=1 Tax=Wickerhamomyces anomalus (strain ATCC 58044 / CBS 1984 / NCYC 433 / NRRL Y-366-8) TaxID=683960 RepID=A0A1E3P1Z5_WICAA|nr:uncharacterized protein WICANDRAFT_94873 [Wickerhamomyces anomalus NRRL Y-366-8]ODQ59481.1 hypothetical protein WICANDRAFT_94873 [Wickerhamomyces anomalus NRRL Y-366-8]
MVGNILRFTRHFSSFSALKRHHDFKEFETMFKQRFTPKKGVTIKEATLIESIHDIIKFRSHCKKIDAPSVDGLFNEIVEAPNFRVDEKGLKKLLLMKLPIENTLSLIKSYNVKNPSSVISKETAMIPLRKCLWDGDVDGAIKIVDLTTGSDKYISKKKFDHGKDLFKYFGGFVGSIGVVDFGLRSVGVEPMMGMYAMFATYVLNMTFFATMAFSGKIAGKSDNLQFVQGIPQTYRVLHSDELEMLSRTAEVDAIVNGVDNFASAEFVEKISGKNLELIEPESQILLQEYWLSGGDNFEWVEPDQDPAELLWKQRLQKLNPKTIKADTKWTEKLIEAKRDGNSEIKNSIA